MSLIKIREESYVSKQGHKITKRIVVLKCDGKNCYDSEGNEKIFERKYVATILERKLHFCCTSCASRNTATNPERVQKIMITKMKRYGNPHYNNIDQHKQTCIEKYGVSNVSQIKEVREKKIITILKNFGVSNPMKSESIKNKAKKTNLKRYGCTNPMQNEGIIKKGHETKKRNNSYGKSKLEDLRYSYLCEQVNSNNIERQIPINGWSIDFFDSSVNEYEEFRGDYFHGRKYSVEQLLRMAGEREAISGKSKSQYRTIATTKLRDIEKDKWFADNGLVLRVIWESDFLKMLKDKGE